MTSLVTRRRMSRLSRNIGYTAIFSVVACASFAAVEYARANYVRVASPTAVAPATPPSKVAAALPQLAQRQARYIARTTLKSLADAARSGNFTVFRDLTGPSLQARFSSAELHQHFDSVAHSHAALSAISLLDPVLTAARAVSGAGSLRIEGYFSIDAVAAEFCDDR